MTEPNLPPDPFAAPGDRPAPPQGSPPPPPPPSYGSPPPQQYGGSPPPQQYGGPPPPQQYGGGYPAQQYGGYPPQQPVGYRQPQRTNGMAIASMVLGILWLYWVGSVLALVFGYIARNQIRERGDAGTGMAVAGIVLGWVGVGILTLGMLVFIVSA